jgi:hypothetical protein
VLHFRFESAPTIAANLKEASDKGWHIHYGLPGKGSRAEIEQREIVVDPNLKDTKKKLAAVVGHELGHLVRPPPKSNRLTLQNHLTSHEVTETAAVLNSMKMHYEFKKNKPELAGDGSEISKYFPLYKKGYELYMKDQTEESFQKAQQIIGPIFMNKEISSTDPNAKSYKERLTKDFRDTFPGRP